MYCDPINEFKPAIILCLSQARNEDKSSQIKSIIRSASDDFLPFKIITEIITVELFNFVPFRKPQTGL